MSCMLSSSSFETHICWRNMPEYVTIIDLLIQETIFAAKAPTNGIYVLLVHIIVVSLSLTPSKTLWLWICIQITKDGLAIGDYHGFIVFIPFCPVADAGKESGALLLLWRLLVFDTRINAKWKQSFKLWPCHQLEYPDWPA